jgi:hypothetical protein
LVVSANEPPRVVRQTLWRHVGSKATRIAPGGERRSSARRYPHAPVTYASSSKRRGCRCSTAPRPTWARQCHISSRPTFHLRLMWLCLTSGWPQPWWKKRAWCLSLRHLCCAGIRVVDPIDLRIASSPPSRRKSTNPDRTPTSTTPGTNLDKNRRDHDTCGDIDQRTASVKSESFDVASTMIASTAPWAPFIASCVTKSLKLIPYYCLNHSPWPLSNNIEVTCRLCRVKPGKSHTS